MKTSIFLLSFIIICAFFDLKAQDTRYLELQKIAMQKLYSLSKMNKIKNFDLNQPIEKWPGLTHKSVNTEGHITSLDLSNKKLTGALPAEIGYLTHLTHLYLNNNDLKGKIPKDVGNLTNLEMLYLNHNKFSGEIPKEFGKLIHLLSFYLNNNQLKGNIPNEIKNLISLEFLNLDHNELTGTPPTMHPSCKVLLGTQKK